MLRDIILFGVSVGVLCLYFAFLLYEWFLNKKKMRAETDKTYNFILPAAKRILSILQNRLYMELKEETLKSKFLGFPVLYIAIVYAIIQMAAFAVFLFVPAFPAWSAIVVCPVIAGVSAICMITADVGRDEIKRVEVKVQKKVFYIRELQTEVELLAAAETDVDIKTALAQLAEKIRFSDPMSNEQLADLENKISAKVLELKTAANKKEVIAEITLLLDERNRKCKFLK